MKVKKSLNILVLTLAATTFTGCSDWLDYTPKDKTTEAQQFSSRAGFYSAVNGVYNDLSSNSLYGNTLSYGAIDLMSQRYESGSNSNNMKYLWTNFRYTDSNIESTINSIWQTAYQTILNTNVILEGVETQKGVLPEADKNMIKGDLLALRAYLHFDLLRLFGPVYTRDKDSKVIPYNDSTEPKAYDLLSSSEIVNDHLLPDLETAEACLTAGDPIIKTGVADTTNTNGDNYRNYRQLRLNYYAVALLKARIYQWMGDSEHAIAEARKITDNKDAQKFFPFVNPDKLLGNTYNPDRIFSSEVLFGIYNDSRSDIFKNYFDGANLSSTNMYRSYAGYIEKVFPNQADYRFQSQWERNGSYYDFSKFKEVTYDQNNTPLYVVMMPLMRISEAYYIAAEELMKTGQKEQALSYLNTILQKRGATPLTASVNNSDFTKELKLEYIREFWGEGQIFFMFKRKWSSIGSEFNGNTSDSWSSVSPSNSKYVMPMPTSEKENR